MIIEADDYIAHYGTLHKSGRFPWGSGEEESTRNRDFLQQVKALGKQGMTEVQIAKAFDLSTTQLRARHSIAVNQQRQEKITTAEKLQAKGMSNVAIARQMGTNESNVRSWLAPGAKEKADVLIATSEMLKKEVGTNGLIDVGSGTENHIGLTATKLKTAVAILEEQGYKVHTVPIRQVGTGKDTKVKVLCPPDTTWGEVMKARDQIRQISTVTNDYGHTFEKTLPPIAIDPSRVGIKYAEDGGTAADGVIFVRPGVKDTNLGNARYAQVRVQVGNDHYLKGMAMYKDDLPDGIDLEFHTNKSNTGNKLDAMKSMGRDKLGFDPENPFGALIPANGQIRETDAHGNARVTSVMNKVRGEGEWGEWSKTVSTQMLSKQSPQLAKTQLDLTYSQHVKEFDELSKLTNPTVRRMLLEKFGDETDSSAVHLDAAAINARQRWHVILPVASMPPTQIYAPNFLDGERVVLIRFPHAGTFEIPELVVNNNHPEAKRLFDGARDAVGIHSSVAERLSGADFDGDTVLVIPNGGNKRVKSTRALDELKNFNPRVQYRAYPGMPEMTARQKATQMGDISNLITDMTLQAASPDKIARAVKHSMVVIDAEKHHLDWKRSLNENGIPALKEEYQGKKRGGASTLISRAKSDLFVPDRRAARVSEGGPINKATGARNFVPTGQINYRTGAPKLMRSTKLAETTDAHTLVSDANTSMERLYADHSNRLKALANEARKASVNTPLAKYSPSAKKTYSKEVASLDGKLNIALRNSPLERQAQLVARTIIQSKLEANPNLDQASIKKMKGQALTIARLRTGAGKQRITLTQEEWNAIQAGAISDSKLKRILSNADIDTVRKLATPRADKLMTAAKTSRARQMLNNGATRAEVAAALGVSLTTLDTSTNPA